MFEKVNPCHPDKVADRIVGSNIDVDYVEVPQNRHLSDNQELKKKNIQ